MQLRQLTADPALGKRSAGRRFVSSADPAVDGRICTQKRTNSTARGQGWRYGLDVTEPDHVSTTRAVYDATAEVYAQAIGTQVSVAFEGPIDRGFLAAFAELVSGGDGLVADVGCGPGRVAAYLAGEGLDVVGVDVSEAMLTVARAAHPELRFEAGTLTNLPFRDESLAGAACWYSTIHTPPDQLDEVFAEVKRVLQPGGHLLVAFQAGAGERVSQPDAYGSGVALTRYRHSPDNVRRQLGAAGFSMHAQATRDQAFDHESTPQAFLLARRPPA